ncbi:MAG: hypothetical protein K0U47_07520 [Epsilonproteobacteria bacterium]|nr:hypothetical protein [Campylobacterota bacterium]
MKNIKKEIVSTALITAMLTLTGCGDKEVIQKDKVTIQEGKIAPKINIGSTLEGLSLQDQFEKTHTLKESTTKVIFVFTKATGHLVNEYLKTQSEDFLEKRDIQFVADVSRMPSLIRKYVAMPDLQKSSYPIMLIMDEEVSAAYKSETHSESIMIVSLDKYIVKNVNFISTLNDLQQEVE